MGKLLHITNGDMAAERLRASGLPGETLAWRETWLDGPAIEEWDRADAITRRAAWLQRELGVPADLYAKQCAAQLAVLEEAVKDEAEIVLWFEYDLFDQAMLAALLYWLERRASREDGMRERLSWVIADSFPGMPDFRGLGQLSPSQIASLWPQRASIGEDQLRAAARAWSAFASPRSEDIAAWLERDGGTLPVMTAAFRWHLKRIPSERDGLGVVEQVTLEQLTASAGREGQAAGFAPDALFGAVSAKLPMLGMGDLTYWAVLNRMAGGGKPLIVIDGPQPLPDFGTPHPVDWTQWKLTLTSGGTKEIADESPDVRVSARTHAAAAERPYGCASEQADRPYAESLDADIASEGYWIGGIFVSS